MSALAFLASDAAFVRHDDVIAAAQASSEPRFAVGRERVGDAEARVDDALATYALLGYRPA